MTSQPCNSPSEIWKRPPRLGVIFKDLDQSSSGDKSGHQRLWTEKLCLTQNNTLATTATKWFCASVRTVKLLVWLTDSREKKNCAALIHMRSKSFAALIFNYFSDIWFFKRLTESDSFKYQSSTELFLSLIWPYHNRLAKYFWFNNKYNPLPSLH